MNTQNTDIEQENHQGSTPPEPEPKNKFFLIALPIIFIAAAIITAAVGKKFKPVPEKQTIEEVLPVVEVVSAKSTSTQLNVTAEGNVQARTETNLFAEVSGRIQKISPDFFAGGFFKKGDILIEIDPTDYEANLATAVSRKADAHVQYQQEFAQSEQAREDWISMNKGEPNELVLRKPQLARAKAQIDAAEAAVKIAERDLERTRIKAPYDGRVREKFVDLGQSVNARATSLARIYSIDIAEVRLPLSLNDIGFLELPETFRDDQNPKNKPKVVLSTQYAGQTFTWDAELERTEGTIDPKTRLTYVVAQVQDPYAKNPTNADAPPLKIGMFVKATIHGKTLTSAFELPIRALRPNNRIVVINEKREVDIRTIKVIKENTNSFIISSGIEDGELICTTPLEYIVNGMKVEIEGDEKPSDPVGEKSNEQAAPRT